MTHRPIWNSITKFCSHYQEEQANASASTTTTANSARSAADFLLPFVDDVSTNMNLCQHPDAAYIEREFLYDETTDVDWESKHDNLYWAGSNTGGYAADESWRLFQRQRFLSLAQNRGQRAKQYSYLREEGGVAGRVQSSFLNSKLFDVSLTRIFQCKERYCREQKLAFNTRFWADKNEALKSKLAFDVDGNGISGRWYKLLASKSTPLKQTLIREWHDERLVPWVHYIPVSQSMEELPELVTYLTSTEAGQQRARQVAEQGREWYRKAFREVDMGIYMYRLMLELARLQDPSRKADQRARP
ncbi:Beta-1 [Escovopsis weberi]|uniref:Beta-1 n=1 Tax=Escovopsis weberi TaxID=150374 RepID=A0A0M9VV70_ESCWE|nr:Beta-1 [Escovopsis weberi]